MWKAMCFFTRAIIVPMNLEVVIGSVNGQAWDKAITQSWSLNKSYSIHGFLGHVNLVLVKV